MSKAHLVPYTLLLLLAVLVMRLVGCGKCVSVPCPEPIAIFVTITASGSPGPVNGSFINVSGATMGMAGCNPGTEATECYVPGVAGRYDLEVGAPGLQTTHRTVTVHGTSPECGCDTVTPEHVPIVLVPRP